MTLPKQQMTINTAEYFLLKPGLDILVNGLADAKLESFPHCHPYDRIDPVASAVYEDRVYDGEMATRVLTLRSKFLDIPQSRKIRLDSIDIAAASLALRLWKAHKPSGVTEASFPAVELLQQKLERYRLRAKRAAIKKFGKSSYQGTADRRRRFAAWARYHLLCFKLQSCGQPYRSKLWREQRQRLTELFRQVLGERFFECPGDSELTRIVTLGTTSARRGRLGVTLRTLLNAPESYGDTLFQFIDQRIKLKPLPGAPIPFWK